MAFSGGRGFFCVTASNELGVGLKTGIGIPANPRVTEGQGQNLLRVMKGGPEQSCWCQKNRSGNALRGKDISLLKSVLNLTRKIIRLGVSARQRKAAAHSIGFQRYQRKTMMHIEVSAEKSGLPELQAPNQHGTEHCQMRKKIWHRQMGSPH